MFKDTKILKITNDNIKIAANAIKEGKLVIFPTETVYGIGANALDNQAVKEIFEAKGRPQDNPLIVHLADIQQVYPLVKEFPDKAVKLAEAFWPGPLTIILPKSDVISYTVTANMDSIAVRIPSNIIASQFLKESNIPVAAPSANISGKPSPTTAEHCYNDLKGKVDYILDGGSTEFGLESTVISLVGETQILLRPGEITIEQLESVIGNIQVNPAILRALEENKQAISPGLKHKHYAPNAKVFLVNATSEDFINYCNNSKQENLYAMAFDEEVDFLNIPVLGYGSIEKPQEQAHNLFAVLRRFDENIDVKAIYVHAPNPNGIGLAVYNRLLRAANFNEVSI